MNSPGFARFRHLSVLVGLGCLLTVALWSCRWSAEHKGRHILRCADGRGEESRLDRHQHQERLEAHFRVGNITSDHQQD